MPPAAVQSIWDEPAVADRPERTRWDWILLPGIVLLGVIESLDTGSAWRAGAAPVALVAVVLLRRRREQTFPVAVILFAIYGVLATAMIIAGVDGIYDSGVALLVAAYTLVRWASGRDAVIGLGLALPVVMLTTLADNDPDVVGSILFWGFPILLGAIVRSRANLAAQRLAEARQAERQRIARELHDSVAHHVSAIAVQAKVARALFPTDPNAALDAMETVERQASTTLDDMRRMVGALRDGPGLGPTDSDLGPLGGLDDIVGLGDDASSGPTVEVDLVGDLDDLSPSMEAGLFRLVQESVTNARRHARHATRIDVRLVGTSDGVELTVVDDGDPVVSGGRGVSGYGLVGMEERAALLGGSFETGPGHRRGWAMRATLPKSGSDR